LLRTTRCRCESIELGFVLREKSEERGLVLAGDTARRDCRTGGAGAMSANRQLMRRFVATITRRTRS